MHLSCFQHEFLNEGKLIPVNRHLDAPELESALEVYSPDVIISYGYIQKFQRRAVNWAVKNNKKVFYISDSEYAHKTLYLKEYIKRIFLKNYFKHVDIFLTVGNHNEQYYCWMGIPMQKLIRNGFPIDVKHMQIAYDERLIKRKSLRDSLGIEEDEIVITQVGKILDHKRQQDIIHVLLELEKKPTIRFTSFIIGSGAGLNLIKELSNKLKHNRVIFTGFIYPEDLSDYLAATDIYVHPASIEPHSLSISEAIYMGCPAIISNRCGSHGPTDDVQSGKNGFIYECGSIDQLKGYLLKLGKNFTMRNNFSKNSHEFALRTQSLAHGDGLQAALIATGLL